MMYRWEGKDPSSFFKNLKKKNERAEARLESFNSCGDKKMVRRGKGGREEGGLQERER